jgi:glutathione S-transferase
MAGAYSAYGIKRYTDETKRLLDVLESRLSKADWLAGDKYTLADIASYSWARGIGIIELSLDDWPGVSKWSKRIGERPAVKKAMAEVIKRSPEEMEAMFKSMRDRVDAMKDTDKHDS